jgi:hypothetical protein
VWQGLGDFCVCFVLWGARMDPRESYILGSSLGEAFE